MIRGAAHVSDALVPPGHDVSAVNASALTTTELDLAALLAANCAEALQAVVVAIAAAGCDWQDVFDTPDAQTYTFACRQQTPLFPTTQVPYSLRRLIPQPA